MNRWPEILKRAGFHLALVAALPAVAAPAQIVFLRHAEKPAFGPELTERGRERAQALVKLFTHDPRVLEHGPATAIYPMKPGKGGGSVRAVETMVPTAQALHLPLQTRFLRDDFGAMVRSIMTNRKYEGATVVICWEHNQIPEMLKAFGWSTGPDHWRDRDYDRLWLLDFAQDKPVRFRDLPQKLLEGDSEN